MFVSMCLVLQGNVHISKLPLWPKTPICSTKLKKCAYHPVIQLPYYAMGRVLEPDVMFTTNLNYFPSKIV